MSERQEGPEVWPDRLKIRDTKIHTDEGQRVYTTAGMGYTRQEYVRADIHTTLLAEKQALEAERDRLAQEVERDAAYRRRVAAFMMEDEDRAKEWKAFNAYMDAQERTALRTDTGGHSPVRENVNTRFDPSRDFRETHSAVNPGWKPRTETGGE